ncbi:hypothetical protein LguiA_009104 [Lonicera macranthoides]
MTMLHCIQTITIRKHVNSCKPLSYAHKENVPKKHKDNLVLEKIHAGVWARPMSLQEWVERVLALAFRELKWRLATGDFDPYDENLVIRLESDTNSDDRSDGDCLPDKIRVIVTV